MIIANWLLEWMVESVIKKTLLFRQSSIGHQHLKLMVFVGDQRKYVVNLLESNIEHKIVIWHGSMCTDLIFIGMLTVPYTR